MTALIVWAVFTAVYLFALCWLGHEIRRYRRERAFAEAKRIAYEAMLRAVEAYQAQEPVQISPHVWVRPLARKQMH